NAPASRKEKAEALVKRALAHVGTLALAVEPAGAEVLLDGKPLGKAPVASPMFVEPGAHVIEARQEGDVSMQRSVDVQAGGRAEVVVKLARRAAPPPRVRVVAKRPLWPVAVGGALAVGGLAAGVGLAVAANGKASDVAQLQSGDRSSCSGSASSRCTDLHE